MIHPDLSEHDQKYRQVAANYEIDLSGDFIGLAELTRQPEPYRLPTLAHAAIKGAMTLLAIAPEHRIVEQPVFAEEEDSPIDIFANLVNSKLTAANNARSDMRFTGLSIKPQAGDCPKAEARFAEALAACDLAQEIKHPHSKDYLYPIVIFAGKDEEPLFLKKFEEASTALALQPFDLNGVEHPAGTIAQIRSESNLDRLAGPGTALVTPKQDGQVLTEGKTETKNQLRVLPVSQITRVVPLRLSMYGHRFFDNRLLFAQDFYTNEVDPYRTRLAELDIDNFREGARFAMKHAL